MLLATLLNAQAGSQPPSPAGQPAFDVASIKVSTGDPSSMTVSHGNLTVVSWGLQYIIAWAYDVPATQVIAPNWDSLPRFDIVAKSAAPASEAQVRVMLQALLAERFKLTVHHETRETQVMAMVVRKDAASQMKPSADEGFVNMSIDAKNSRLDFQHANMADVATILSAIGEKTVDKTGITGRYDFYAPYAKSLDLSDTSGEVTHPAWREAILSALGLKLEARKLPMDAIVIDHCEKAPTAN